MMKMLKKIGIVLGVLAAIVIAYLMIADFGSYKPEIEAAVSKATGREFHINGELHIRALPRPTVQMQDVTLANAPWSEDETMLQVGSLSAELGIWSLLFGPIVVRDFQLHDVTALVETAGDGASNLDFDVPDQEPAAEVEASSDSESPVDIRNLEITNVEVTARKPQSDDMTFELEHLSVATDDNDQQLIDGLAEFLDRSITLNGIVSDHQAEIEATFGNIRYHSLTQHKGTEADVDITVSSLTDVGDFLEISDLPAEDLTLSGHVALHGESVVLSDVTVGVGTASLTLDGTVDGATAEAQLELSADAPSLAVLGQDLPDIPASGSASILLAENSLQADPVEFRFGDSDLSGAVNVIGDDDPSVVLQASSTLIDLQPFAADEETGETEQAPPAGDDSPYVFREDPLPLATLHGLNIEAEVSIDQLRTRASQFDNVLLTLNATDGKIQLENTFDGGRGGKYENRVQLQATESSANLTVDSTAHGLKLGALSGSDVADDQVPATNLDLAISATGASPRQLAASADGKVLITQGPGRIKNDLIGRLSGDLVAQLFSALNPLAEEEEYSNWDCSIFAIDFDSGVGEITGFLLQGEKLMIVGGGGIDLNTEKLSIEFNTKPRAGVGVSADMFVTPFVALTGTLADPGVGLNAKGVLLGGGLAVATGGLSFLYQGLADRATAEADQCEKVLAEVGGERPE